MDDEPRRQPGGLTNQRADTVAASQHSPGRIAGIDYGTVRIGIAVSDARQSIASPYENYVRRGEHADAKRFKQLVEDEQITRFVVGLPVHTSGKESQKSREARQFGAWLAQQTGLPVEFFDERYTSSEAEQHLLAADLTRKRRKARLDMLAAQILLQAYLESKSRGQSEPGALED